MKETIAVATSKFEEFYRDFNDFKNGNQPPRISNFNTPKNHCEGESLMSDVNEIRVERKKVSQTIKKELDEIDHLVEEKFEKLGANLSSKFNDIISNIRDYNEEMQRRLQRVEEKLDVLENLS